MFVAIAGVWALYGALSRPLIARLGAARSAAWAAFLGALTPILCRRAGIDPAVVAGPFLIAMSDLSGTAIFIGVARLILASGGGGLGA